MSRSDFSGRLWYRHGSVKVVQVTDGYWQAQWQDAETERRDGPRMGGNTALRAVNQVREFHDLWRQQRLTGRRAHQVLKKHHPRAIKPGQ